MFTAEGQKSSSSISPRSRYDVFLSFRGKDTRTGFTDHLYTALVKAGFETFRDDDEITPGENIASELRRAVRESRVSIVVFSKDYASSRWCLDELVHIMERKRIDQRCVMPVFYKVDAGHVKYLCGDFAAAFAKHEKHPESETDRVRRWKTALREAADLSGFVLGNRFESGFIRDIVVAVQKILDQEVLGKLKILDLSRCRSLIKTPDLYGLPSLERLILKGCVHLTEVDDSIGNLEKLVILDLSACRNLRKVSKNIGVLKYLEELDLSHCSMLQELPLVELGRMDKLKVLRLDRISLSCNELECAIRDPRKLITFPLQSLCSILRSQLPCAKISKPVSTSVAFTSSSLVKLRLAHCNLSENAIAIDFSRICSLEVLDLKGNPFWKLPNGLSRLRKLHTLTLNGCREIQVIELPAALEKLWVVSCGSLKRVMNLPQSRKISFYHHGTKLVEVEGFFKLRMFTERDAEIISHLGLFNLESYRSLPLCTRDKRVQQKGHLQVLHEYGISSLFVLGNSIPNWYQFQSLGPSISFVVPPCETGGKISGLNMCMLIDCSNKGPFMATNGEQDIAIDREEATGEKLGFNRFINPAITCTNITKGKKWWHSPSFWGKPRYREDMLWLSHWKVNDTMLQAGDTVSIESGLKYYMFRVDRCGVHVVYENGEEGWEAETEYTKQLSSWSAPNWHGALRYFQRPDQNLFFGAEI